MVMTAKEMLEELGYKLETENKYEIRYAIWESLTYRKIITFDLGRKIFFKYNSDLKQVGIEPRELKAIHQQLIELGWIDDRDTPKKVIFEDGGEELLCPTCYINLMGSINEPDHDPYYCFECGQALDWSGEK